MNRYTVAVYMSPDDTAVLIDAANPRAAAKIYAEATLPDGQLWDVDCPREGTINVFQQPPIGEVARIRDHDESELTQFPAAELFDEIAAEHSRVAAPGGPDL